MSLGRTVLKSESNFLFYLDDNCHAVALEPKTADEDGGFQIIHDTAEERLGLP